MGDTVDALGYKADVKARTHDYVVERRNAITGKASGAAHAVGGAADAVVSRLTGGSDAATSPTSDETSATERVGGMARDNALGVALAGVGVGLVVGLLLPSTRIEYERVGPVADEVKDQVKETGQEVVEHGKQIARETAEDVQEHGKEHVSELVESAKEHGREAVSSAREQAGGGPTA
jgi:hypothetical protein